MSRAFVKEAEDSEAFEELPERIISEHPNLVTASGLAMIENEVARLTSAYAEARAAGDRSVINAVARDLRYWIARRANAELIPEPADAGEVHFGSYVTIERDDGRRQTFRIVGEDEADPSMGTLSYVSPLARGLFGKAQGDVVRAGSGEVEIVAISTTPMAG
jgi:transcription elongation GreA/GreB family factor